MSTAKKVTRKARKVVAQRNRLNPEMFLVPAVKENPRRKGSFGFKSLAVILKSRKPMQVAKAVDGGARLRDIHWDIEAGNLKLVKKAS